MLSIVYGLLSAFSWGAGDFTGGLAARSVGAVRAVFYASVVGLVAVGLLALRSNEAFPSPRDVGLAFMAGLFGVMGLIFLYAAMSKGLMSIAAPVSALLAALIPVIVGIVTQGLPNYLILVGFVFALLSIWVISQGEDGIKNIRSHLVDLKLPLLAGLGFGCYFVFVHQATGAGGVIWPMVISRVASVSFLLIYMLITKTSFQLEKATVLPAIFLNGILDLTGNGFFILATQTGRLDVAAVLSSLFPGATVLLASIFLKERLNRNQWVGVVSALIAIVLMTM